MNNRTDNPSQIRFGGINENLFEGAELKYLDTKGPGSWKLPLNEIVFGEENILDPSVASEALINPAFPFIAAPIGEFNAFKNQVKALNIDNSLVCNNLDWCYFETKCDNVRDKVPNLQFKLGAGDQATIFSISSDSFLFKEENAKKKKYNCHLAIVGQDFTDHDYWVLGDIFNYNFYTVFDAEDEQNPKIGLAI